MMRKTKYEEPKIEQLGRSCVYIFSEKNSYYTIDLTKGQTGRLSRELFTVSLEFNGNYFCYVISKPKSVETMKTLFAKHKIGVNEFKKGFGKLLLLKYVLPNFDPDDIFLAFYKNGFQYGRADKLREIQNVLEIY